MRLKVFIPLFFLSSSVASACSCGEAPDPTTQRASAHVILEGEVIKLESLPNKLEDLTRATIRVARVTHGDGHLAGFVRVDTPVSEEACGYPFRQGEKREFLIRRVGQRFFTSACLMLGAREDRPLSTDRTNTSP